MKKINVKATIFLSAIVLVVVVLLLNLIEFRKTVDFTVPGIRCRRRTLSESRKRYK